VNDAHLPASAAEEDAEVLLVPLEEEVPVVTRPLPDARKTSFPVHISSWLSRHSPHILDWQSSHFSTEVFSHPWVLQEQLMATN
jgi:hypothetical protein